MSGLRLMAVHAHPDDESSKGAATLARYAAAGHRVLVVTLTGIGVGQAAGVNAAAQRAGNPLSGAGMRHAVLAVQLVLCVPESVDGEKPPPARDVTAAGHRFLAAAGLLSQALVEACTRVRALTDPAGSGFAGLVTAGAVETLGPTGGMAAVEGTIQVTAGGLA